MTARQRDLLLTLVMLGILLTPAWLAPRWLSVPWQIGVAILAIPALWAAWTHAPWQPTPRDELERILGHLALTEQSRFCDLGAGDGRLLLWVHAATGADCTGIELSPLQWAIARARLALQGTAKTRVRLGDLYRADLSAFDVVYVWGTEYSVGTPRFGEHVRRAMRPGARLISYHHPVHGLEPRIVDEGGTRTLFIYEMEGYERAPRGAP